jgi:hypothetical protein
MFMQLDVNRRVADQPRVRVRLIVARQIIGACSTEILHDLSAIVPHDEKANRYSNVRIGADAAIDRRDGVRMVAQERLPSL